MSYVQIPKEEAVVLDEWSEVLDEARTAGIELQ